MALTPGTRLGSARSSPPSGPAGWAKCIGARDTRLDRDVAIKILPDAFAADAERIARFQREARVLASLDHPNIAIIHGLEHADGAYALVMELVEGEDLAQRIVRGAMPPDEALPIAKQIAEALEAAHEQNIIHRDSKPANIKVRPDGTVKVLDFGLAKAMEPPASSPGVSQSPTITTPVMTQAGMILGTVAYLSPEQAKGKPADKRGDIWAFGCVLYEMLTGRRAFDAEDVSETLAAVLMKEPDWTALPATTPATVTMVLRRCLQKDWKRRARDIGDVLALEGAFETTVSQIPVSVAKPAWRRPFSLASFVLLVVCTPHRRCVGTLTSNTAAPRCAVLDRLARREVPRANGAAKLGHLTRRHSHRVCLRRQAVQSGTGRLRGASSRWNGNGSGASRILRSLRTGVRSSSFPIVRQRVGPRAARR